jgi:glycosyltransferase involved in cell wall biosynthesis
MRILMVAQFYVPVVGGEERMTQTLAEALVRRGHHVALATLRHSGLPARETIGGVTVYRIQSALGRVGRIFVDSSRPHAPPSPDPEAGYELWKILEGEKPDVVHAHNWLLYSLLPLHALRDFPFVVSLHDYSLVCATKRLMQNGIRHCSGPGPAKCMVCAGRRYGPLKGAAIAALAYPMGRVAVTAVDLFLPVSESVARGTGVARRKTPYQVISNFLPDTPEIAPHPRPELEAVGDGYVLFVGDATADKGIETLLDAHARLRNAPPLVVIGRPLSPRLRALPPNVVRVDPVPHPAVLAAMQRAAIVVMPSILREAFGLTAIEAMSMGRPVVATTAGALPEVVAHGEAGLLVPPGDTDALQSALRKLLADEALRRRLGEGASRRAAAFRASNVIPRFEHAYARVVEERRR